MMINAGRRAGIGTGRSQEETVFPSRNGQGADWLSATHETSEFSISGTESFRSRWQAMLNTLEAGPIAWQKTGPNAGQGTGSGAGQGTAIAPRLRPGIEAGSEDEKSDLSGEVGGTIAETLPQGPKSGVAAVSPDPADAVPRSMRVIEQTGVSEANTTELTLSRPQGGNSEWPIAAPQVQSVSASVASEASGDARTGRSVRNDKRDSTAQRLNAEPQAAASDNGTPGSEIAVASAMQAQILSANFAGLSQSVLRDCMLSSDRGPDPAANPLAGSATVTKSATRITEIAARPQINSRAATGNHVSVTPSSPEGGEASKIPSLAPGETGLAAAKQLNGSSPATGTQAETTQQAPGPSQHRTENGSSLVEAAQAPAVNSGTYHATYPDTSPGTNLGAEADSAFDFPDAALNPVAEKANPAGGGQFTAKVTVQTAHGNSAGDGSQPAMHVVLTQQAGAGLEVAGMARVQASAEGTASVITEHASGSVGVARGTSAGETFAAMDAGREVGTPGWVHAGGRTAEAGFQDPALGWVGVRADLSAGNVHAALMPGSAEAAQTLSGHLAGLNSYLAEQHTPVASLTMAAASGSEVETGTGRNLHQGAGQNLGQDAERNTATQSQSTPQPGAATIPAAAAQAPGTSEFDGVVPMGEMRGRHISVMA